MLILSERCRNHLVLIGLSYLCVWFLYILRSYWHFVLQPPYIYSIIWLVGHHPSHTSDGPRPSRVPSSLVEFGQCPMSVWECVTVSISLQWLQNSFHYLQVHIRPIASNTAVLVHSGLCIFSIHTELWGLYGLLVSFLSVLYDKLFTVTRCACLKPT